MTKHSELIYVTLPTIVVSSVLTSLSVNKKYMKWERNRVLKIQKLEEPNFNTPIYHALFRASIGLMIGIILYALFNKKTDSAWFYLTWLFAYGFGAGFYSKGFDEVIEA